MDKYFVLNRLSWIEEDLKDITKVADPMFEDCEGYTRSVADIKECIAEIREKLDDGQEVLM